ncbi:MAG: citrulline utilization hydrolase CtlX [Chitinophagales bacterium]
MQTTSHLLMIQPVNFSFNAETAVNNAFQTPSDDPGAQDRALSEFNDLSTLLENNGIDLTIVKDENKPSTPDSIFPNNWVSFHENGTVCLYPMFAENRRHERKPAILNIVADKFQVKKTVDLTSYENNHLFLEGTGSMVLDRENKIAYACLSPRTDKRLLTIFSDMMGYKPIAFAAEDGNGKAIYHTNVMMCVADKYVVICMDAIPHRNERSLISSAILNSGKEIIEISLEQMNHFAGNMLQVQNKKGENLLIMSTQAFKSLTPKQVKKLESYNRILHSSLDTIEANGGGSARCMLAEIHLPVKKTKT